MGFVPKPAPSVEVLVAIYSLNHRPIGKTTQSRPYTASSHIGYITRDGARPQVAGARMPLDQAGAQGFFRDAEDTSRKNGRVGDKLMLALPRELSSEQRVQLVRGFAEEVTAGRAPWFAAFHDNEADAHNPHCHMIFRDRCPETKRRVFGTTEAGSTERLRGIWERHTNDALEGAGWPERVDRRTEAGSTERLRGIWERHTNDALEGAGWPERVDRRSLEAQGIERKPPIHEGPKSQAARRRGRRPRPRPVNARNGKGARSRTRQVDYPAIDRGRTRGEYNRALAAGAEGERDYWDAVDADQRGRELDNLRAIHHPPAAREPADPNAEATSGRGGWPSSADRPREDPGMKRGRGRKPNRHQPRGDTPWTQYRPNPFAAPSPGDDFIEWNDLPENLRPGAPREPLPTKPPGTRPYIVRPNELGPDDLPWTVNPPRGRREPASGPQVGPVKGRGNERPHEPDPDRKTGGKGSAEAPAPTSRRSPSLEETLPRAQKSEPKRPSSLEKSIPRDKTQLPSRPPSLEASLPRPAARSPQRPPSLEEMIPRKPPATAEKPTQPARESRSPNLRKKGKEPQRKPREEDDFER